MPSRAVGPAAGRQHLHVDGRPRRQEFRWAARRFRRRSRGAKTGRARLPTNLQTMSEMSWSRAVQRVCRISGRAVTDFVLPFASDVRRRSASKGSTAARARTGATLTAHAAIALGRVETGPERPLSARADCTVRAKLGVLSATLAAVVIPRCRVSAPAYLILSYLHPPCSVVRCKHTPVTQRAARLRKKPRRSSSDAIWSVRVRPRALAPV